MTTPTADATSRISLSPTRPPSTRSLATEPGARLEVSHVAHAFGERIALDGVSFSVVRGVLTGLLGPNGAGKTTVMRVMLGVLSAHRGEIRYDGQPVAAETRRRWGYMPQERGLYPAMRVGEQVSAAFSTR